MPKSKTYKDDYFCEHCEKDTMHEVYSSGHERDSSHDKKTYLECGWYVMGMTGEYMEPYTED